MKPPHRAGWCWPRANRRAPAYAVVQVSSLASGLLALVLLVLLRTDLIASWRQATPPDAPNRFVINIQPDQAEPFRQRCRRTACALRLVPHDPWPPGRREWPTHHPESYTKTAPSAWWSVSSTSPTPRSSPRTTRWWLAAGRPANGRRQRRRGPRAETPGLKLGDRLRLTLAACSTKPASPACARWTGPPGAPTFFVMFPCGAGARCAAYLPGGLPRPEQAALTTPWCANFPNITNVDMGARSRRCNRARPGGARGRILFGFTLAAAGGCCLPP